MRRVALVFGPAMVTGIFTAVASVNGWPFPQILVQWGAAMGAPIDALTRPVFFFPAWPAIVLVFAAVLSLRRRSPGTPDQRAWDGAASITLALCAVPFFTGVERDVGSNFISHWQCWDCPRELRQLGEGLAIGPGTARCSMDGLPYRLLARLAWTLVGDGWLALRLLSGISVLGATAWTYGLLSRHLSGLAALAGMVLFATSPLVIDLAHVPSFLGPSVLLCVAIFDTILRWVGSQGERGGGQLGLLLFIGLYGYSPLRFLLALLPLAALFVVLQRHGGLRRRLAPLLPVGLCLVLPLIVVMGLSRSDPVDLFYADGEFLPTQAFAEDGRFRVITHTHGPESIVRTARELWQVCLAGIIFETLDDGVVGPFTAMQVTWILLGLIAAAAGRAWGRPLAAFVALAAIGQIAAMLLMYPPAMRRMVVFGPLALLVGAGGIDFLLPNSLREGASRVTVWVSATVVLVLLLPVALASMPGLKRPDRADVLASPCDHVRWLADTAVGDGRTVLLWADSRMEDAAASGDMCDYTSELWGFYCTLGSGPEGPRVGQVIGQDFPADPVNETGEGNLDAPVAWVGRAYKLVFLEPGSEGEGALLESLEHGTRLTWCD